MNRGFTVVEVLVTLIVIGILLGLGTVGLRSTLANGRDSERKSDIETIARGLEFRYDNGNAISALPQTDPTNWPNPTGQGKGYYPGVNEFIHMQGSFRTGFVPETPTESYFFKNLQGATEAAITTPSGNKIGQVCVFACAPAGDSAQLATAFNHPTEGKDRYLYESVNTNNGVCSNGDCVAFNLYWISETDTTVNKGIAGLKIHRSKRE